MPGHLSRPGIIHLCLRGADLDATVGTLKQKTVEFLADHSRSNPSVSASR
ncbi:VOC family protein [Nocardioides sp. NBC_00850]|nr:VOC family protein [Nocardioides sp. NBC_00850]